MDPAGDRRQCEAPVEARFWCALGRAWAWILRCTARITPTQHTQSMTAFAGPSGAQPAPEHFTYELFLDERGQKIFQDLRQRRLN